MDIKVRKPHNDIKDYLLAKLKRRLHSAVGIRNKSPLLLLLGGRQRDQNAEAELREGHHPGYVLFLTRAVPPRYVLVRAQFGEAKEGQPIRRL